MILAFGVHTLSHAFRRMNNRAQGEWENESWFRLAADVADNRQRRQHLAHQHQQQQQQQQNNNNTDKNHNKNDEKFFFLSIRNKEISPKSRFSTRCNFSFC